jgi:hypothetical protein
MSVQVPSLRSLPFESSIIERYRPRQTSVDEVLIEMYRAERACAGGRYHAGLAGLPRAGLDGERS